MEAASRSKTRDIQARVDDYLDDKIQTTADLDDVNGLISRVHEQQTLLKKQVCITLHRVHLDSVIGN